MKWLSLPVVLFFVVGLSSIGLSGCDVSETESAENSDGDDDGDDGDAGDSGPVEHFEITAASESAQYSIFVSKDDDTGGRCIPTVSDPEITCIVDMEELDLFVRGLTLKATAPAGVCKYLEFKPYYYNVAPFSVSTPYRIFYQTDDGELVQPATAAAYKALPGVGGDAVNSADVYYAFLDNTGTPNVLKHATLYGVAATGADEARCPWDYSEVSTVFNGKNCCVGYYFEDGLERTGIDDDDDGTVDRYDSVPVQGFQQWGGSVDNCMRGSGITDWEPRNSFGFPLSLIYPVEDGGYRHEHTITAPISLEVQEQIFATNYYSGTQPDAIRDGSAYYRYDCLDNNDEVIYRINVQIREWNEAGEMIASGDPDSSGNEDTPFGGLPINDYADWADVTPASGLASFGLEDDILDYLSDVYDTDSKWIGFNPD